MQAVVPRGTRMPRYFVELFVGAAALLSAGIAMRLTRVPGGIALFWPPVAIAAAVLIRWPTIRLGRSIMAVFGALVLASVVVAHRPWVTAVFLSSVNLLEMMMMVAAFRYVWRFRYPHISIDQACIMTAVFGIAIPGVTAAFAGLSLRTSLGLPWTQGAVQWWSSHTIGACLLGPPIILFSSKEWKRLLQRRFVVENAFYLVACVAGCYLTISYVRFPFVSIGLLLLMSAFRLGGFGASLMSLGVGLVITNLWILGIRPEGLDASLSSSGSLIGLPVVALLATVIPPIAVGLGSDARRAATRALRMSERRIRESMEHSPMGMLISDLEGRWGYTNRALQRMLGFTAEEFRAMPPGGPSKADDWTESKPRWARLIAGEIDSYDTVRCFEHKDGRWVWTHVAVSLLRDDDGRPLNLIAQIESLEARQRAEEKLAEERERLRITLQSINDAVITTDASTHIIYINAAAETLLGLDMKTAEGRRVDEVIHLMDPLTSRTAPNLLGQAAFHGSVFRREQACLLHRSDGSMCFVTDVVSPVFDANRLLTGMVIVFHDATSEVDRARDLQHRAMHDPLTGLGNRAQLEKRLAAAFTRFAQTNRWAAVLAIDLDRFKAVNDAAGHAAGDEVLCKVAETCLRVVRSSDLVARVGGDEFAILLDDCPETRAVSIGQQLVRALNPLTVECSGSLYSIGASIGLAMITSATSDEKAWMKAADEACYAAKRDGRGRLEVAHLLADAKSYARG